MSPSLGRVPTASPPRRICASTGSNSVSSDCRCAPGAPRCPKDRADGLHVNAVEQGPVPLSPSLRGAEYRDGRVQLRLFGDEAVKTLVATDHVDAATRSQVPRCAMP